MNLDYRSNLPEASGWYTTRSIFSCRSPRGVCHATFAPSRLPRVASAFDGELLIVRVMHAAMLPQLHLTNREVLIASTKNAAPAFANSAFSFLPGDQIREAPTPLDAVLFTIEIEVVASSANALRPLAASAG